MFSALTQQAHDNLFNSFAKHGHNPSSQQQAAILAIQNTLTLMLAGIAAPKYYLSSLDPGMGKTTAILTWLDAYLGNLDTYGDHGVLIALDRLDEIPRWIEDSAMLEHQYAVLVSDMTDEGVELNNKGLGRHRQHEALVLLTTKKQIRNKSIDKTFCEVSNFHYKGQPRKVKIWDESFTVGEEVILNPCDLGLLLTQLESVSPELVTSVVKIMQDIREFKAGGTYFMPELRLKPNEHGNAWDTVKERDLARLLCRMSRQPVSVHYDKKRHFIVDSSPKIPDDFAPCLVLDASARLKATYELQDEKRGDIIRLLYSNKSYRNLEVRVWERKSGKKIIAEISDIVPELAALIHAHQGEEFLIVLHKDHKVACKRALSKELSCEQIRKVKFCTWARHTSTNEFCDIPNIIMLSPFQLPDYAYEATTRAATAMTSARSKPKQDHISRVKKSEICSNILQAVNRGKPRKSEGDTCPPCRLWLITHPSTGIAKELDNIFPDCKIAPWKVKTVNLSSSKQRKTFAYLQELVKQSYTEVLVKTVRDHLEFTGSASNFTRDVLDKPAFREALGSIGMTCVKEECSYIFRSVTA